MATMALPQSWQGVPPVSSSSYLCDIQLDPAFGVRQEPTVSVSAGTARERTVASTVFQARRSGA
jgi:hypothetical protein